MFSRSTSMLSNKLASSMMTFNRNVMMRSFATVVSGDKIPSAVVSVVKHDGENGFQSEIVDAAEYLQGKRVVIVGYPGAFTPTCMATHVPDFIAKAEAIKAAGCDEILALSVNDPFVVTAFAEKLGGKTMINYVADGNGELTKALGLELDLSVAQLGDNRTKRCSMLVSQGQVLQMNNEDGPALTEISGADRILQQLGK